MASLSAQLSSSIKIHIYTGKYAREHAGVRKGCVHISLCVCEGKMNHGDGWAQANFSQSLLASLACDVPISLPIFTFTWRWLFAGSFMHQASQDSFQGRWCWTSKEESLWSGRALVPSPCPMCCSTLPSITFRPLKGDSSEPGSTSPQTAAWMYYGSLQLSQNKPPCFMIHMPFPPPPHFALASFQIITVTCNNSSAEPENTIFFQFAYSALDAISPLKC